jgi:hypothetical protein
VTTKIVGLLSPLQSSGLQRTLEALGEIFDVRFEERAFGEEDGIDAWFFNEPDHATQNHISSNTLSSFTVILNELRVPCGESGTIEFSRHTALPHVLAGRRIISDDAVKVMALPQQLENMTVLASKAGAPVWEMQEFRGRQRHNVSLSIPELGEGEHLFQYFHGKRFLHLLPLVLFLRNLTEDLHWRQPPLQASFMLDDPNLHWRTYGFVDYKELALHAREHNYHMCFATIPLDTWFVHKPTALLFRQYQDQLSLLIHGNDHRTQELSRFKTDEDRNSNLSQALFRIDQFERRSGVEVSKVMAPPHGACSENSLRKMAHLGYEAACISRWSLRHYNSQATWLRTLGMNPADIIAGLTVFPRFRITHTCHNSILVAALLHQPIIPVGHHHDLAQGFQMLADLAEFINSLGTVHWQNMREISRSHYAQKMEGRVLRVRMLTKHIEIEVPEGVSQILVERPWLNGANVLPFTWRRSGQVQDWTIHHPEEPISVQSCQRIEIIAEPPIELFVDTKRLGNYQLWPVVRRQLTEARDRLLPALKRTLKI